MKTLLAAVALSGPAAAAALSDPATATTLTVGPGQAYPAPSAAIAAAKPGDTVQVAPGTYYDCAAWGTDHLTIMGTGPGVVLSDRSCQGKAALVIGGAGTRLSGLTFANLRVPDHNAAGIRLEGGDVTVEDCTFENDEAAIIAGDQPGATITVRNATVHKVGVAGGSLTAITVGAIGRLRIENSQFSEERGGGAVHSAAPTEIVGGSIETGADAGVAVDASGPLAVEGTSFRLLGPRPGVIRATGPAVSVRHVTLENRTGTPQTLLLDWSASRPVLDGNVVAPGDTESSSRGLVLNRVKSAAHTTVDGLRHLAGRLKRAVRP